MTSTPASCRPLAVAILVLLALGCEREGAKTGASGAPPPPVSAVASADPTTSQPPLVTQEAGAHDRR